MAEADRRLLLDFLNTATSADPLDSTAGYEAWLRARGVLRDGEQVGTRDLEIARRLRDVLRAVVRGNSWAEARDGALAILNELARGLALRVRFGGPIEIELEAAARGVEGYHASILAAVYREGLRGDWGRYKLCRNPECEWAFFDASRNRSRLWCEMQVCGARAKMRAYRARRAAS